MIYYNYPDQYEFAVIEDNDLFDQNDIYRCSKENLQDEIYNLIDEEYLMEC